MRPGQARAAGRIAMRALRPRAAVLLLAALLAALRPSMASADTAPPSGVPATVTADALPTVQVNGVVWAQVVIGNTVYVTGHFSKARPAGVPVGGPGEVARPNLLAYDITTGKLKPFHHSLNGEGLTIARSPDGRRLYVGGEFTKVDGKPRLHLAAFDPATGALVSAFHPQLGNDVKAIAATNGVLYVGGDFFTANGKKVTRLAKFRARDGALYRWPATAGGFAVQALLVSPDAKRVVVAGRFTTLDGVPAPGIGAVDAVTGAHRSWSAAFPLRDNGAGSGFTSLVTDGKYLYGSGFNFAADHSRGNFEGRFASDFAGHLRWLDSCHGDTYDVFLQGGVLYSASHAHDCSDMGAWDETSPRTWHRALAETTAPSGHLLHNGNSSYHDFRGLPAPKLLHWYPNLTAGTFTGQGQAAWSVAGNGSYVSFGGEFPSVNGVAQQGLVRFAIAAKAPKKVGPNYDVTLRPIVASLSDGTARVRWQTTWDEDNESLTYRVFRDTDTVPAFVLVAKSNFWSRPWVGFVDRGLTPGSTHTYHVEVTDPDGNLTVGAAPSKKTISSTPDDVDAYGQLVLADGARRYWPLSEAGGAVGYDRTDFGQPDADPATPVTRTAAYDDLSLANVTQGVPGPRAGARTGTRFAGSSGSTAVGATWSYGPGTYSIEAWVRTTSTQGGEIVGFGNRNLAPSGAADRQLYFDDAGKIHFGMRSNLGAAHLLTSPGAYNDGAWHYVVGTFSPNTGMHLYVDGTVQSDPTIIDSLHYQGYWHVGGDTIGAFAVKPSSGYLAGDVADVAVYAQALSADQVSSHSVCC